MPLEWLIGFLVGTALLGTAAQAERDQAIERENILTNAGFEEVTDQTYPTGWCGTHGARIHVAGPRRGGWQRQRQASPRSGRPKPIPGRKSPRRNGWQRVQSQ